MRVPSCGLRAFNPFSSISPSFQVFMFVLVISICTEVGVWLVWRCRNGVGPISLFINKNPRRTRIVLRLVTFSGRVISFRCNRQEYTRVQTVSMGITPYTEIRPTWCPSELELGLGLTYNPLRVNDEDLSFVFFSLTFGDKLELLMHEIWSVDYQENH